MYVSLYVCMVVVLSVRRGCSTYEVLGSGIKHRMSATQVRYFDSLSCRRAGTGGATHRTGK